MIAFGPVPSRRLGMSLGINNIGSQKGCSYACEYCQLGNTSHKSMFRRACFEPKNLVKDVEDHLSKLDKAHMPDYLTFVANGEPTLDVNLGEEIRLLQKLGIPIAVITNATLVNQQEVRNSLMEADWVSVKVDTVDDTTWKKINNPLVWLNLDIILNGIKQFAADYIGKLHTETMLIEGYNDDTIYLEETAAFIASLKPNTSYLSIPTRPTAATGVKPVSETKLTEAWHIYDRHNIKTELLTGFEGTDTGFTGNAYNDILNISAVHPLREDTISELLRKENADNRVLSSLISQGLIKSVNHKGKTYYMRNFHTMA
jgi:wyosine [tRNA(Phe)-imidazoG37] synthetase (radical SAM superfamily)